MFEIRCGGLYVKIESTGSPRDAALQALRSVTNYYGLKPLVEITDNAGNTTMLSTQSLISVIETESKLRIHEE